MPFRIFQTSGYSFATLPALSSHDFCKEKEREVRIDVQDVQDARVTVKRKALTAGARLTITTCKLKVIFSQKESSTFATMSVLSNMFDINIYFHFDCFSNSKETFTKITMETAAAKIQCNFL